MQIIDQRDNNIMFINERYIFQFMYILYLMQILPTDVNTRFHIIYNKGHQNMVASKCYLT